MYDTIDLYPLTWMNRGKPNALKYGPITPPLTLLLIVYSPLSRPLPSAFLYVPMLSLYLREWLATPCTLQRGTLGGHTTATPAPT
jgi:hypothetical protein